MQQRKRRFMSLLFIISHTETFDFMCSLALSFQKRLVLEIALTLNYVFPINNS